MKVLLTVEEIGQKLADHLVGCLQGKSQNWSCEFKIEDGKLLGCEFESPRQKILAPEKEAA